jgi:predicted dehydrogenase
MLKVAIVGCGNIADEHAAQIQRIRGCEIVGVCDKEPLRTVPYQKAFQRPDGTAR